MRRRAFLLVSAAAGLAVAGGTVWRSYSRDMREAEARLAAAGSQVFNSRFGPMEYGTRGEGPPVLAIHGTGGGFDQGLSMLGSLADRGWRLIAPSRFGYLRTPLPPDPSSEAQADAFADLLDHLGIERAAAIGGSAGALPALAFALRYPDRCAALVALVPAAYVPGRPTPQPPGPVAAAVIDYALASDLPFWLGRRLVEDRMIGALLATDPALVHAASPEDQAAVRAVLRDIAPIRMRADGLRNDARRVAEAPNLPLELIACPTLAISVEDDRFETAPAARHIAASVPGAELVILPQGGHAWVGHAAEVTDRISDFLRGRSGLT
jgi:pimeloyl-ACP methyl ester carboxylesterase